MRVTDRDIRLVKDMALSHLLSRDQIIDLGFFSSITRANTRLRELSSTALIRRLETPFFAQSLYVPGCRASEIVGSGISNLIDRRSGSPRFVCHALSVTNARIALSQKGVGWRFEQQLWRTLETPRRFEIRPDGLILTNSIPIFVEVDLGHVAPAKFKEKLAGYSALTHENRCRDLYGFDTFRLLTITTGSLRARHLRTVLPKSPGFDFLCQTFEETGVRPIRQWS